MKWNWAAEEAKQRAPYDDPQECSHLSSREEELDDGTVIEVCDDCGVVTNERTDALYEDEDE